MVSSSHRNLIIVGIHLSILSAIEEQEFMVATKISKAEWSLVLNKDHR